MKKGVQIGLTNLRIIRKNSRRAIIRLERERYRVAVSEKFERRSVDSGKRA